MTIRRVPNPHALLAADEQPPLDPITALTYRWMTDLDPPDGWAEMAYERYRATVAPRETRHAADCDGVCCHDAACCPVPPCAVCHERCTVAPRADDTAREAVG